jgi:hypothetical protein
LLVSKDGLTWTEVYGMGGGLVTDIAYGNESFVVSVHYLVLGEWGTFLYSTDGKQWTDLSPGESSPWRPFSHIFFTKDHFVVFSEQHMPIISPDGKSWPTVEHYGNTVTAAAYGNGRFVAVQSNGAVALGTFMPTGSCRGFHDLAASHPACRSLLRLEESGAIGGYPDGSFQPDQQVTRAEFAKMLVKALKRDTAAEHNLPFSDVKGHWAAEQGYLQGAVYAGAINGYADGTLRPDNPVTRAEAVKMVVSLLQLKSDQGRSPYKDIEDSGTDTWYRQPILAAMYHSVIGPESPTRLWNASTFEPDKPATRAEAAMLLGNVLETIPDADRVGGK